MVAIRHIACKAISKIVILAGLLPWHGGELIPQPQVEREPGGSAIIILEIAAYGPPGEVAVSVTKLRSGRWILLLLPRLTDRISVQEEVTCGKVYSLNGRQNVNGTKYQVVVKRVFVVINQKAHLDGVLALGPEQIVRHPGDIQYGIARSNRSIRGRTTLNYCSN